MTRRKLLQLAGIGGIGVMMDAIHANAADAPANPPFEDSFEWNEATITTLQSGIKSGKATAASLARQYLDRIAAIDKAGPAVNAVIEVNPDAMAIAQAMDEERKSKRIRGPLHGVAVMVKDNIDTRDRMMTTAGSLAMVGSRPPRDAFVVEQLRRAGAVIIAKTNLSEWANFRSNGSTSGWSGRGGLTKNPYALDRNPSGSSSGSAVAVAANLCAVAVGTETDGSIVSPASLCGIVGIKPTVGLVSRSGIIPISSSQDTAGPMARTVTDAAILLEAMAGVDPRDPATRDSAGKAQAEYTRFLDTDGLRGARIGVARQFFERHDRGERVIADALAAMQARGAVLVDPIEMPSLEDVGKYEFDVMLYEFKAGINSYFASLGPDAPMHSLEELIEFNKRHTEQEIPYFGQSIFLAAQAKGPLTDAEYLEAVAQCRRLAHTEGIDAAMDTHHLDAIVGPSGGPAAKTDLVYGNRNVGGSSSPAAVAGYPNITVPAGQVCGLPVGISFFGRAYSEPVLLKLAYAFEQATGARKAPRFFESVG